MGKLAGVDIAGIENLRVAVVERACYDYLYFLRKPHARIRIPRGKNDTFFETKSSLEKWFHSKQFEDLWCTENGRKITDQLQKNYKNGIPFSIEKP